MFLKFLIERGNLHETFDLNLKIWLHNYNQIFKDFELLFDSSWMSLIFWIRCLLIFAGRLFIFIWFKSIEWFNERFFDLVVPQCKLIIFLYVLFDLSLQLHELLDIWKIVLPKDPQKWLEWTHQSWFHGLGSHDRNMFQPLSWLIYSIIPSGFQWNLTLWWILRERLTGWSLGIVRTFVSCSRLNIFDTACWFLSIWRFWEVMFLIVFELFKDVRIDAFESGISLCHFLMCHRFPSRIISFKQLDDINCCLLDLFLFININIILIDMVFQIKLNFLSLILT